MLCWRNDVHKHTKRLLHQCWCALERCFHWLDWSWKQLTKCWIILHDCFCWCAAQPCLKNPMMGGWRCSGNLTCKCLSTRCSQLLVDHHEDFWQKKWIALLTTSITISDNEKTNVTWSSVHVICLKTSSSASPWNIVKWGGHPEIFVHQSTCLLHAKPAKPHDEQMVSTISQLDHCSQRQQDSWFHAKQQTVLWQIIGVVSEDFELKQMGNALLLLAFTVLPIGHDSCNNCTCWHLCQLLVLVSLFCHWPTHQCWGRSASHPCWHGITS